MIRITTGAATAAQLKRHRLAVASQCADAIETLLPGDCTHRHRPSCPKCSARQAVLSAIDAVRETGGVKP